MLVVGPVIVYCFKSMARAAVTRTARLVGTPLRHLILFSKVIIVGKGFRFQLKLQCCLFQGNLTGNFRFILHLKMVDQ